MPLPFAAISTLGHVRDYAKGAALAAAKKCPKTAADYLGLHQEIVSYIIGNQLHPGEMAGVAAFKDDIKAIRSKCTTEMGSGTKKQGKKLVKTGSGSTVDLDPGVVISETEKAGFGLGGLLLAGGLAYLLLAKKKGK